MNNLSPIDCVSAQLKYIREGLLKLSPPSDLKSSIVAALADVSIEHGESIILLIKYKLFASVFALDRPIFETTVRALWFSRCATQVQLETFAEKDKIENVPMRKMVDEVEAIAGIEGNLKNIYDEVWKPMNSFVHGGAFQVGRRIQGKRIGAIWDFDTEHSLCMTVSFLTFVCYSELLLLCGASDRLEQLAEIESLVSSLYVETA